MQINFYSTTQDFLDIYLMSLELQGNMCFPVEKNRVAIRVKDSQGHSQRSVSQDFLKSVFLVCWGHPDQVVSNQ